MLIKVTDCEIRNGVQSSLYHCPVALALQEAFGEAVWTCPSYFVLKEKYYRLPYDVNERIVKFDKTGVMEPFQFEVKDVNQSN